MLQFFKFVLATIVGLLLTFLLIIFITVGIVSIASSEEKVTIDSNSVLKLKLDRPIEERSPRQPLDAFSMMSFPGVKNSIGLNDILSSIRKAKTDDNIKGIYLQLGFINGGLASMDEIRTALLDFKTSGKFVAAYSELYSEKAYYLASVADKIVINPVGALEFNGLSTEVVFIKGTLEKLGIEPYIFKVGDFKSAVEPFMLKQMSEPSRQQTVSFLNSIHDYQLRNIAGSLNKSYAELKNISDSMLVKNPDDALRYGLVTDLDYYDNIDAYMRSKTDTKEDKEINFVELSKYRKVSDKNERSGKNRIAVIYATGNINSGEGDDTSIGSDRIAGTIRKARLDKSIKAIVLRINSPGGNALASDVIWHEVMETKGKKPIIASMSDVAASGGYYLAMACDTIVAHPTSITGSIGVFGVLANLSPFLEDKLGITVDRVKTGRFSDVPSFTRDMTNFEKQAIQREVDRIYDDFTAKAARGRNMTQDQLKQHASGRVWSGLEAKERGLIDVLGGLEDAIRIAAAKAGVEDDYRLRYLPHQKNFLEELMSGFKSESAKLMMQNELGPLYPAYSSYKNASQYFGIQTRMPFDLIIQ